MDLFDGVSIKKMLKNASHAQKKILVDYKATINALGDIRSPLTPFSYQAFLNHYSEIIDNAKPNEIDKEGEYFRREIVFYMNRSMGFVKDQREYYALSWSPSLQQNKWESLSDKDMQLLFKHKQVVIPSFKRRLDKESGEYVIQDTSKKENLFSIYVESPNRREFNSVCFKPGEEPVYQGMLNMWMGYKFTMNEIWAAAHDTLAQEVVFRFLKELLYKVICNESPTLFSYWLDWWATKYRNPGVKLQSTLISYSPDHRVGKGTCIFFLGYGFGQHYVTTSDKNDVAGRWSSVGKYKVVMFLDEALWAGDKAIHGALKAKITEKTSRTEEKYKNPVVTDNPCSYVQASNNLKLIPADQTEMRYVICEASPHRAGDVDFYKQLEADMCANNQAGIKCLMYLLMHGYRVTPGFGNGHKIPHTHLLRIQKESSADSIIEFMRLSLERKYHVHPRELTDNTPSNIAAWKSNQRAGRTGEDDNWITLVTWNDFRNAYTKFCEVNHLRVEKKEMIKQRLIEFWGCDSKMETQCNNKQTYEAVEYTTMNGEPRFVNLKENSYQRYWTIPSYEHCSRAMSLKSGDRYIHQVAQQEPEPGSILNYTEPEMVVKRNVVIVEDYGTPWHVIKMVPIENSFPYRTPLGRLRRNVLTTIFKEQVIAHPDNVKANIASQSLQSTQVDIEPEDEIEMAEDEPEEGSDSETTDTPLTPRQAPPEGWIAAEPRRIDKENIFLPADGVNYVVEGHVYPMDLTEVRILTPEEQLEEDLHFMLE